MRARSPLTSTSTGPRGAGTPAGFPALATAVNCTVVDTPSAVAVTENVPGALTCAAKQFDYSEITDVIAPPGVNDHCRPSTESAAPLAAWKQPSPWLPTTIVSGNESDSGSTSSTVSTTSMSIGPGRPAAVR